MTAIVANLFVAPANAVEELKINQPLAITGIFGVNQTLQTNQITDPLVSANFQWRLNGEILPSQTAPTLNTDATFENKTVSVEITLTKPNFAPTILILESPGPIKNITLNPQGSNEPYCREIKPNDGTKPLIGWNLNYYCQDLNTSQGTSGDRLFRFFRGSEEVQKSNSSLYRISPEDVGQKISSIYLRTWTSGLQWQWFEDFDPEIQNFAEIEQPKIIGNQQVGELLQVQVNAEAGSTLSYQWYKDLWPIPGETNAIYLVKAGETSARIQVLVTAEKTDRISSSRISPPLNPDTQTYAQDVIAEVASLVPVEYDVSPIEYVKTDLYPSAMFELNQTLLDRTAAFWESDFQPTKALALYFTPEEVQWADAFMDQRFPTVSISLANQIALYGCPYATASYFSSIDTYFFVQCGTESDSDNLIYRHITPHEYTHWVQYSKKENLYMPATPWLVEGQGNFYGLALAELSGNVDIDTINWHLAHQAFNFDNYLKLPQSTHQLFKILESGNSEEIELLLTRSGSVHEQYLLGHLMAEYLVGRFGHELYWQWSAARLNQKSDDRVTDLQVVRNLTSSILGISWDDLYVSAIPYLSLRANEIRTHYLDEIAPKMPPNPPNLISVVAGDGQVRLTWANNGDNGSTIIDYRISWNGGSQSCNGSSCTISGLDNGQRYSFSVQARNEHGFSQNSNFLDAIPAGVPDSVTDVIIVEGDKQVELLWDAPFANGSPISGYKVSWSDGQKLCDSGYCRITGLKNGTTYSFQVTAINGVGESPSYEIRDVIPYGKPTGNLVAKIKKTASLINVKLTAIDSNGSAITNISYQLKQSGQKKFGNFISVGAKTTFNISKLAKKTKYIIKFKITNAAGNLLSKEFSFTT